MLLSLMDTVVGIILFLICTVKINFRNFALNTLFQTRSIKFIVYSYLAVGEQIIVNIFQKNMRHFYTYGTYTSWLSETPAGYPRKLPILCHQRQFYSGIFERCQENSNMNRQSVQCRTQVTLLFWKLCELTALSVCVYELVRESSVVDFVPINGTLTEFQTTAILSRDSHERKQYFDWYFICIRSGNSQQGNKLSNELSQDFLR